MRAVDILRKKRDAGELSREEIEFIVQGAARNTIPDYQLSAWLMAVVLRGMTAAELAALTEAMLHSGEVIDFSTLAGAKVDKHSTGGVGDKTSLVIAPVVKVGSAVDTTLGVKGKLEQFMATSFQIRRVPRTGVFAATRAS